MSDRSISQVDLSEPAAKAAYLFSVGDFMLAFSLVVVTTALAAILYGTNEYRPHNAFEAAIQIVLSLAAFAYVLLLAWRGYSRRYWLGHAILGSLLTAGILAGILVAFFYESQWSWLHVLAFAIFAALFLTLAAIPFGFALSAYGLLTARVVPDGMRLTDAVDVTSQSASRQAHGRLAWIGKALLTLGAGLIAALVLAISIYGLAEGRDPSLASRSSEYFAPLLLALPVAALLISVGRRLSQPSAARLLEADERAPILLLRSFADDSKQIAAKGLATRVLSLGLRGRKRLEAAIADEIARLGPFVAIGQPGEKLPPLGAARSYFSDDEWQLAVVDWIARARLIVMVAGRTPWVQWELRQIVAAEQLAKLLLLLPPGDPSDRRQRLALIAQALDDGRLQQEGIDWGRAIAIRFFGAAVDDESQRPATIFTSNTSTEVDYELAVRLAVSATGVSDAPPP